jgi:hypothetical protein
MKRQATLIIIALAALLMCAPAALAQKKDKAKLSEKDFEPGEQMERTVAASPNVVVSLCIASGNVQVKGWDRAEVKVAATGVRQLELQGGAGGPSPSQRVQVALSNAPRLAAEEPIVSDCRVVTDLDVSVPRGATVEVKTRAGDIQVSNIAEARIDNTSGDISIDNVTRGVEAGTISGDVSITNSNGRMRLRSISGDVDATNIQSVEAGDDLSVHTTSGDINLENVNLARLSVATTSGQIGVSGRLARRGSYDLNTFSGDVVLDIPADSAFKLEARAPQGGITTDFAVKSASDDNSQDLLEGRRLAGTYGSGDWATLTINSFSGTVRLQKR